ncbi:MAG: hypothetical protein AAGA54_16215 [Myxococcota bacterium]
MDFLDVMHTYFRGERTEAWFYILPAGVVLLGLAVTAWVSYKDGFGYGLAIPLALFGLMGIGTGIGLGLRTPGQVQALERAYAEDPAAMVAEELPRMEKVNANFSVALGACAAFAVVGAVLRLGVSADWAHGVGTALIVFAALGLLVDGFAERRSRPYTKALESLRDSS